MICKYFPSIKTNIYKAIVLMFLERSDKGFIISGLSDDQYRELFPIKNNIKHIKNDIDISSIPFTLYAIYLDELNHLRALIVSSKNKTHYLFKADPQNEWILNIHQKFISNNLDELMGYYESRCKSKGQNLYGGVKELDTLSDIDYFENCYEDKVKKHIDKESMNYRLEFTNNNVFTEDFIHLIEKNVIKIVNQDDFDLHILSRDSMIKLRHDRHDCLIIDSDERNIKYFIFTFRPKYINHYLLLKKVGTNKFQFIKESVCFNQLFEDSELKDIRYRIASKFTIRNFEKIKYDNFYNEYIEFEEEEEFDEAVINEFNLDEQPVLDSKELLLRNVEIEMNENHWPLDINVTLHGKARILERIGDFNDQQIASLAKVAYEKGLNSAHFIEKDSVMFKFLQYHQNKRRDITLRLYQDILFFYALKEPHDLITCFYYQTNFELFKENNKRLLK